MRIPPVSILKKAPFPVIGKRAAHKPPVTLYLRFLLAYTVPFNGGTYPSGLTSFIVQPEA